MVEKAKKLSDFNMSEWLKSVKTVRVVVLGETGSGKTFFLRRLIKLFPQTKRWNTLILDLKPEFNKTKSFTKSDIFQKVWTRKIVSLNVDGKKIIKPNILLEFASAVVWYFRPACLYIEEGVKAIEKNDKIPVSHPLFYQVLQMGRSRNVSCIFSTQMVSQTNLDLFKQASECFFFWMKPFECRLLEETLGFDKGTIKFEEEDLYTFYYYKAPNTFIQYNKLKLNEKEMSEAKNEEEIPEEAD